ncbi:hypothetical protein CRE_29714 [Caenorhabditis remanei]|uniref:Uncharacterized protein n=1 Tax=Caenorhabditis remanei TaxID=31234 RepID=E3LVC6_CAERE|nr:hypothetical protein CRE_29714 [Caenorhabditis remanei]
MKQIEVPFALSMMRGMLIGQCKQETKKSHLTCQRTVNNGLQTLCEILIEESLDYEPAMCQSVSYSNIKVVDTSSPWFSAVIGLFIGFLIAVVVVFVMKRFIFSKNRQMMSGASGASTVSK